MMSDALASTSTRGTVLSHEGRSRACPSTPVHRDAAIESKGPGPPSTARRWHQSAAGPSACPGSPFSSRSSTGRPYGLDPRQLVFPDRPAPNPYRRSTVEDDVRRAPRPTPPHPPHSTPMHGHRRAREDRPRTRLGPARAHRRRRIEMQLLPESQRPPSAARRWHQSAAGPAACPGTPFPWPRSTDGASIRSRAAPARLPGPAASPGSPFSYPRSSHSFRTSSIRSRERHRSSLCRPEGCQSFPPKGPNRTWSP